MEGTEGRACRGKEEEKGDQEKGRAEKRQRTLVWHG